MELNHSTLHHVIVDTVLCRGYAPNVSELETRFGRSRQAIRTALQDLQDYHGVVLQPDSDEVWIVHPFSMAPSSFLVRSGENEWWGNCAWCSLGVAALAGGTASITTTPGNKRESVSININKGVLLDSDYYVHFPIKMSEAWNNVHYTCSMMLVFENESDVDVWCARHGKVKGDVRPIDQIWRFSQDWYGRHADRNWSKWTVDEASQIFKRHGLDGPVWEMDRGSDRF